MRQLHIIGIGAGDPDHITIQAIKAMNEVDVFFIPDKGEEKADLKRLRTEICERFATDRAYRTVAVGMPRRAASASYHDDVDAWHAAIQDAYEALFTAHLGESECGGLLVWGDPTLYDSTLRIIARLHAKGFALDYDVIPGISSIQALAASHRVALNGIGETITIAPGRRLDEGFVQNNENVVVVLDGDRAYRRLAGEDLDIFWGADLGTQDECLVSGCLADVADEIDTIRQRKRDAKGWIMDTYLLRRR